MVDDRITDGKRIAQILASELSGREDGPLGAFEVVDADSDAEPSLDGTLAYGVAVEGERVADVVIYPEGADVVVTDSGAASRENGATASLDRTAVAAAVDGPGLSVEREDTDRLAVRVAYAAAVKRAVDALVAGVER